MSPDELAAQIARHDRMYYEGHPVLSDTQYDVLVEALRKADPHHPVLSKVGSPGGKTRHLQRMLSLAKCHDVRGVARWAESTPAPYLVQPKYDGCALSLIYGEDGVLQRAVTRGDGDAGDDVTTAVRLFGHGVVQRLPEGVRVREVRGEAVMPRDVFTQEYSGVYANPRNLVAGLLLARPPRAGELANTHFVAYDASDTLARLAQVFEVGQHWSGAYTVVNSADQLAAAVEYVSTCCAALPYETDGVVVKCLRMDVRARLGATEHHPRWAIAYKFAGQSGQTTYRTTAWQVSRAGTITPVAVFDSVSLSGVTVERATLHTFTRFVELDLVPGDTLLVSRRGGVIPHVESVVTRVRQREYARTPYPVECPSCRHPTTVEGEFLVCGNSHDCPAQRVQRCVHFAAAMGMMGWGEESVTKAGVAQPCEFYQLDTHDMVARGFGAHQAAKLLREVETSRTCGLATVLAALGIAGLGTVAARRVASRVGSLRDFAVADVRVLTAAGLGPAVARDVWFGTCERYAEIGRLISCLDSPKPSTGAQGPFTGMAFVFTGELVGMSREQARAQVRDLGGETPDSVTRATTHLVVATALGERQTGKLTKAQRYGVRVLTEDQFVAMVVEAAMRPEGDP